jgi:hypothetical protein
MDGDSMSHTMKLLVWIVCALMAVGAQGATVGKKTGSAGHLPDKHFGPYSLRCGSGYCDARTSYCETIKTDVPELPSDYSCKPLPKACAQQAEHKGCGCFPEGTRCDFCGILPAGKIEGYYRTCVGGH